MKKMKSYRLNTDTLMCLSDLRSRYPDMTETEIIQKAISLLYDIELGTSINDNIFLPIRTISGDLFIFSRANL